MKAKNVLISVLNYNNFESTKHCIISILNSNYHDYEILIIDNCSTDNSFNKLKKQHPKLNIIKSKYNGGYAYGHQIGVDFAIKNQFEYIWILNNDLKILKNTLSTLLQAAENYGLGLFGSISIKSTNPEIVNFGGGEDSDVLKPFNYNSYDNRPLKEYLLIQETRKVQAIEGSSFLIPMEVIKNFGFMDHKYFMYAEDIDYCFKLNKLGIYSFLVVESIVIHSGGESLKDNLSLQQYYRRRNHLFFLKKYYGKSIIINIYSKNGIFKPFLYLIKNLLKKKKDSLFYIYLANLHAVVGKKGKLKKYV